MKTFEDLKFQDKIEKNINNELVKKGIIARLHFENNFGVSVISQDEEGKDAKLYELMILHEGMECMTTHITKDVLEDLNEADITKVMEQVQNLQIGTLLGVNIWDDYHDDGIGKAQNTKVYFAQLKKARGFKVCKKEKLSTEDRKMLIKAACNILLNHFYCRIVGDEIEITNISHKARKDFLKADRRVKHPTELGIDLLFISES